MGALVIALSPVFSFGPTMVAAAEEETFVQFCGGGACGNTDFEDQDAAKNAEIPNKDNAKKFFDTVVDAGYPQTTAAVIVGFLWLENSFNYNVTNCIRSNGEATRTLCELKDTLTTSKESGKYPGGSTGILLYTDIMSKRTGEDVTGKTLWEVLESKEYKPRTKMMAFAFRGMIGVLDDSPETPGNAVCDYDHETIVNGGCQYSNSKNSGKVGRLDYAKRIFDEFSDCGKNNGRGSGGSGNGKDYTGKDILTPQQMEALQANKSFYESAANAVGIPWEMIATIHYRETRFARSNPDNGQGIYQYPEGDGGPYPPGPVDDVEFKRQTDFTAGYILNNKAGSKAAALKNGDDGAIKYTFFGYNGRANTYKTQARNLGFSQEEAENGEGSPYVMNRFDAKRDPTVEPTKSNGTWGQIKRDYGPIEYPANTDYGAYTIFAAIAGGESCGSNGDITDTAILLSWPSSHANYHTHNAKPEYVTAMKAVTKGDLDGNGCSANWDGASCDVFVTTVYRSTVDPNFSCCGTGNMLTSLKNNPKYQLVIDGSQRQATTADLQSGDILIVDGHIWLYIVLPDGHGVDASASCGDWTAGHGGPIGFVGHGQNAYVFRWKG